ncbi:MULTISPECIES: hypothetical protein, partial [unclassified Pseudomonas]
GTEFIRDWTSHSTSSASDPSPSRMNSVPQISALHRRLWELACQRKRHCKRTGHQVDISDAITGLFAGKPAPTLWKALTNPVEPNLFGIGLHIQHRLRLTRRLPE